MEVLKNLKFLLKINLGNILQRFLSYYVIVRYIILEIGNWKLNNILFIVVNNELLL